MEGQPGDDRLDLLKKQTLGDVLQCSEDDGGSDLIGTSIGGNDDDGPDSSDDDCLAAFEPGMVAQGLSQLGRTASGRHLAYLRLTLNSTTLDTPAPITSHCRQLQVVDVSGNCLASLRELGPLQSLISLDASHNQLTQVLDISLDSSNNQGSSSTTSDATEEPDGIGSSLRSADLSFNRISQIRAGLSAFRALSRLVLDGNQLEAVGPGLKGVRRLTHLSLSGNRINSARGLEGLTVLRELRLDGNRLSSLAPLSSLTSLEVLTAAHNQLASCRGIEGLSSLRRLDVSDNLLRRMEELCACRGLRLLGKLDVAANPLQAAQNSRLCLISLLPQVSCLDGSPVSSVEKVEAWNMAGAAARGLLAIRARFFPAGELDDGGGAVPPTAAGLIPSRAEEERSCADPDAMFAAVDAWARAVPVTAALPHSLDGSVPSASCRSSCCGSLGNSAVGTANGSSISRAAAAAADDRPELSGAAAIAARLAAGCSKDAPLSQLQLARACYSWVVENVQCPGGCDVALGADIVTWDVGHHLFGEEEEQRRLHEVLLPSHSGTFAECVSQLLVGLVQACHMEAVQLSGFWKAGGHDTMPGSRLGCHNHAWVAVKVNGRWRLLDPVCAIIRGGQLPFFLAPEAFIHSHLPFEDYYQLLEQPLSLEEWWQRPEVSLAFCAVGGQLLDQDLRACIELPAVREGQALPRLRIPVAAPATDQQYVQVKLLDSNQQLLAKWQHRWKHRGGSGHSNTSRGNGGQQANTAAPCLVFQQPVLSASGQRSVRMGHAELAVLEQELWVSLPGPGCFYVAVEMVWEMPRAMQLALQGLAIPLPINLTQTEDCIRFKVVVPPVLPHDPADGISADDSIQIAALPTPLQPGCGGTGCLLQLLRPAPGQALESDRPQLFEVLAPGAAAVAVGCQEHGWAELTRTAAATEDMCCLPAVDGAGGSSSSSSRVSSAGGAGIAAVKRAREVAAQQALFSGVVVLPRAAKCLVAVRHSGDGQPGPWTPMLSLVVQKQVQHIVAVPNPAPLPEADAMDPALLRVRRLLAALDTDADGVVSRRDMLAAFRRDRQLADQLRMPPRIKAGDGTMDRFLARFQAVNTDGLGFVDLKQLWAYLHADQAATGCNSRLSTAAASARADDDGCQGRLASAKSSASHRSAHSSRMTPGGHRSSVAMSAGASRAADAVAQSSRRLSTTPAVGGQGQ